LNSFPQWGIHNQLPFLEVLTSGMLDKGMFNSIVFCFKVSYPILSHYYPIHRKSRKRKRNQRDETEEFTGTQDSAAQMYVGFYYIMFQSFLSYVVSHLTIHTVIPEILPVSNAE
jgi:hypothetical protein